MRDIAILTMKERLEEAMRILDTRMEFLDQRQRATETVLKQFQPDLIEDIDKEHQRLIELENAAKMEALVREQEAGTEKRKKILTFN